MIISIHFADQKKEQKLAPLLTWAYQLHDTGNIKNIDFIRKILSAMESEYPGKDKAGKFIKGHQFSAISDDDLDGLVDDYCQHRSMGLDKHSFKGCDYRTIEKNASEYQKEKIRAAESEGWLLWEEAAQNIAFGISAMLPNGKFMDAERCNTTMAIFMIKNKMRSQYGEKKDREDEEKVGNLAAASVPFTIINPYTGEVESISIGGRNIINGI